MSCEPRVAHDNLRIVVTWPSRVWSREQSSMLQIFTNLSPLTEASTFSKGENEISQMPLLWPLKEFMIDRSNEL
jgi:hypothetical protein